MTFALLKNCSKEGFKAEKLSKYEYEVIGGLHNMTAAKEPNNKYQKTYIHGRHSRVYCELEDEEVFLLASRHNIKTAMRHDMSLGFFVFTSQVKIGFRSSMLEFSKSVD